jgi:hypothetical protein
MWMTDQTYQKKKKKKKKNQNKVGNDTHQMILLFPFCH